MGEQQQSSRKLTCAFVHLYTYLVLSNQLQSLRQSQRKMANLLPAYVGDLTLAFSRRSTEQLQGLVPLHSSHQAYNPLQNVLQSVSPPLIHTCVKELISLQRSLSQA